MKIPVKRRRAEKKPPRGYCTHLSYLIASMNIQKRNNSEAFIPISAVERSKKKSALFDDSLEVEENAAFEDEYDENNSVPGGSSQPSTKLNL
ncbi:hypothetical protein G6F35_018181 [Rhizopus arrhizus]|nr:hypothetical protein G6F23_014804 [Rhizopus arrhizus]KAG0763964.1 hypothetical protein G6F24_005595 [Rhizopus arrhizus]KAG0933853.1 hypothetical protein G6F32_010925 [Rhizopus arrhizus]KAG1166449.1 hypothetical protein G6F35_018181 [Rhizopus arrhizus]